MARIPTTGPATTAPRSDSSPETGNRHVHTPQSPYRDRTPPRDTSPHWHTRSPVLRSRDPRAAERLLRSTAPVPTAYPALCHAARTLLHAGRPHRAAVWCAKLQARIQAPAWEAAFGALRAEALLQLGDLAAAEYAAAEARNVTGPQDGQLWLWPTAVLAEALIAQGRYEEAAAQLMRQAPEPSWHSLPWLRVHGRLHLAAHRHHDALAVFRVTARLARRHGTGRLPHVPWRSDIAETLLGLGRVDQARTLLAGELAAVPTPGPRHRGIALRLLATTEEPGPRARTLARAVIELRRCGNHLELARVLADFAHTLEALGEPSIDEAFLRRATHLAADCDATPPSDLIRPAPAPRVQLSSGVLAAP